MLRMLEAQAPAKQTATDTINVLSSRLSSATLLEDRRAAILGLRSFAKQFPASVASGALRDLLAGLRRDGEDSDTIKVVLETLLMLFEPDENSLEASEEITLWLADEFTQRQDNVTALLDLLETGEFYSRLYSLQILSHVCAARPVRASEVVLAAPLGVSRITAVLAESREAVRNEALLLLIALTPSSAELQKVVAFENTFEQVFALIEGEGGLTHGSTTVQDCLTLLANLLTLNTSNQSLFRESGCVEKVSKLLVDAIQEEQSEEGVSEWMHPKRDMNLWGLLGIIQLFLVAGFQGTSLSQIAFWQQKVLLHTLQIAFHPNFGVNVRAKSLETCGYIIRNNASLQEQFGDLGVPFLKQREVSGRSNGHTSPLGSNKNSSSSPATPAPGEMTNIIEALLQLTLEPASMSLFDVRLAACNCVKAFIEGHNGIKLHVLRRAIEGHQSGDDSIPNILTVLLEPSSLRSNTDPYQVWMASVLLLHLLNENPETKAMALQITEGNAEEGEEVVTFIQSLASSVIAGVQHVEDERALIGYLMLLCIWLFEDPEAVSDLLGEGSNVQGLAAAIKISSVSMPLVAGLCSVLLGIIYEFSTKDSPIPRVTLHSVILKSLTREIYIDRLTKLRESPFVRDFDVLTITVDGGMPDVFFDKTFMDFLKDNFSRILRSVDREPSFEVSIISNGVQKGVSRELVDALRAEVEEQKKSIDAAQQELQQTREKLEKEQMEHRRTRDSGGAELQRIRQINDGLQRNNEEEVNQLRQNLDVQRSALVRDYEQKITTVRTEYEVTIAAASQKHLEENEQREQKFQAEKKYLEQRQSGHERELARARESLASKHKSDIDQLHTDANKLQEKLRNDLESAKSELAQTKTILESQLAGVRKEHANVKSQLAEKSAGSDRELQNVKREYSDKQKSLEARLKKADEVSVLSESRLKESETKVSTLQSEIRSLREKAQTFESKAKKAEDILKKAETKAKKAEDELKKAQDALKRAEDKTKKAEDDLKKAEAKAKQPEGKSSKAADDKAKALNQEISALKKQVEQLQPAADKIKEVQTELDDLLVVFADLEAKRSADKKRLKELGEEISEDEEDDDDDDDDDAEDEDDDGVD